MIPTVHGPRVCVLCGVNGETEGLSEMVLLKETTQNAESFIFCVCGLWTQEGSRQDTCENPKTTGGDRPTTNHCNRRTAHRYRTTTTVHFQYERVVGGSPFTLKGLASSRKGVGREVFA